MWRVFPRGSQQEKNKADVTRKRAEDRVGERWKAEWEAVPGGSCLPDRPWGPLERLGDVEGRVLQAPPVLVQAWDAQALRVQSPT